MVRTRRCRVELYTPPVVHPPLVHQCILEMSQNQTSELVFLAYLAMLWPWPVTFWPQNLIISFLSQAALWTKVWWKCSDVHHRYRGNNMDRRMDAQTYVRDGRSALPVTGGSTKIGNSHEHSDNKQWSYRPAIFFTPCRRYFIKSLMRLFARCSPEYYHTAVESILFLAMSVLWS